ncbi:MAG TPA: energy transducer TonB [Candidatus Polarisedimenticolaceae bacterium]|nr:energy transducer TonB [Candidatus Polarisedimenticolaceae bacterium]
MRTGRSWAPLLAGGASLLLGSVSFAQECGRLAVAGILPGMSTDEVHAALGEKPETGQVVLPSGKRVAVEEYLLPDGRVHVEYDGVPSRSGQHVALVRQPMRHGYDTVNALLKRLGGPSAGGDALFQGLQPGPAVWVDSNCDIVLSFYRRTETWYAGELSTFLRVESLSRLPDEAPASATVRAYLAVGSPAPPVLEPPADAAVASAPPSAVAPETEPATAYDVPPVRTLYVPPVYPPGARKLGVKGEVTLHLSIERTGAITDAKISRAVPEGYGFEQAALDAARRWKFSPASRDGQAIEGEMEVVVQFK